MLKPIGSKEQRRVLFYHIFISLGMADIFVHRCQIPPERALAYARTFISEEVTIEILHRFSNRNWDYYNGTIPHGHLFLLQSAFGTLL